MLSFKNIKIQNKLHVARHPFFFSIAKCVKIYIICAQFLFIIFVKTSHIALEISLNFNLFSFLLCVFLVRQFLAIS
jgi:hypothetical protein